MSFDENLEDLKPTEQLEFTREFIFLEDFLPLYLKYTGIQKDKILVDVGCGTGAFSRYLAKGMGKGSRVIGVDKDASLLEFARSKAQDEGISEYLEFRQADAYNLPFENNSVDAVTDHTLLVNLEAPDKFIKEELRVLKSGGTISTATFVWEQYPPKRLDISSEFDPLTKTQAAIFEIIQKHFSSQKLIGFNQDNVLLVMKRYKELGIKDIQVNGVYPVFSPDDSRYVEIRERWLKDMYRLQRWELVSCLKNLKLYESYGITEREIRTAIDLLEKRYNTEKNSTSWIIFNICEIVISGKK